MKPAFWNDRHVVVTGGTSGIGLITTQLLLQLGARVTVIALDDHNAKVLRDKALPNLLVEGADVTDADQVAAALDSARAAHGRIGSVITLAGITVPGYIHKVTDAELRRHMEINYFGTLYTVRRALPDLMAEPGSTVTLMSSVAGLLGVFAYGGYSPSKFAVRGLSEVLRQELKPHGVTVTCVYPPDTDTPMLAAEQPVKPPELRALSDGEKPLSPVTVAKALINGTEAGRPTVLPDLGSKLLKWAVGAAPLAVWLLMDRKIARARSGKGTRS